MIQWKESRQEMKGRKKERRINYSARTLKMTSFLIGSAKKHLGRPQPKKRFSKKPFFPFIHSSINIWKAILHAKQSKWKMDNGKFAALEFLFKSILKCSLFIVLLLLYHLSFYFHHQTVNLHNSVQGLIGKK